MGFLGLNGWACGSFAYGSHQAGGGKVHLAFCIGALNRRVAISTTERSRDHWRECTEAST
jgi:hypothetical protein